MTSIKFEGGPLDGKSKYFSDIPDAFKVIIWDFTDNWNFMNNEIPLSVKGAEAFYLSVRYFCEGIIRWKFKFQGEWVMDCWKCDKHGTSIEYGWECFANHRNIKISDRPKPKWCPIYRQMEGSDD